MQVLRAFRLALATLDAAVGTDGQRGIIRIRLTFSGTFLIQQREDIGNGNTGGAATVLATSSTMGISLYGKDTA